MRAEFESREKNSNRNLNKNWVSIRDKRFFATIFIKATE